MMRHAFALLVPLALAACANQPERPIIPVDAETTAEVYDVTLVELKKMMTPQNTMAVPVNWGERMYLNNQVLLPPADSGNPLAHDSAWTARAVASGKVLGVCGKPPAQPCPATEPIAFVSLSPPWTISGDTVFVQAGYAGEAPGEEMYEAVFWIFTVAGDEETGQLKVVRKGPPNRVTFETRGTATAPPPGEPAS